MLLVQPSCNNVPLGGSMRSGPMPKSHNTTQPNSE
jgi:hypothetical protein